MSHDEPASAGALATLFAHNTWANLAVLTFCEGLSAAQLDAAAVGGFGTLRETLAHIADAEVDYYNLATGEPTPFDLPIGPTIPLAELQDAVRWAGGRWEALARTATTGAIVRTERPDEPIYEYPLAGLLAQLLGHSAGHREQIAAILTTLGLEPPATSGWAFMRARGEFREFTPPTGDAR